MRNSGNDIPTFETVLGVFAPKLREICARSHQKHASRANPKDHEGTSKRV